MQVTLEKLKPNPTRDFHVDPMIETSIDNLEQSIKQDGFWGGVVCRMNASGEVEIAAGHHRVAGAIRAGVKTADLFVSKDMDEVGLIRIYARENATQRGNSGTAQVGTVASALRYLAKQLMLDVTREIPRDIDIDKARQHLTSGRGLGEPIITGFLENIPGVNENTVREQLALLKSSGDYARIIGEVVTEIERENAVIIKEMEKAERKKAQAEYDAAEAEKRQLAAATESERWAAEQERADAARRHGEATAEAKQYDGMRDTVETANGARDKANETEVTFDLKGVSEILDHVGLLSTFRKLVTSKGIQPYLAVNAQAKLAAAIVKLAKDRDAELTSRFIKENLGNLVNNAKVTGRELKRSEKAKLTASNWNAQAREYQHQFSRQATAMLSAAKKLEKHNKKRPSGVSLHASAELLKAVSCAMEALKIMGALI
jgi:ParB-like chromosome segregation protein Spo0J